MEGYRQNVLKAYANSSDQAGSGYVSDQNMPSVDADGYPFEPIDSFSTDPIGFEESALTLLEEARELFWITRVLNRHTPKYQKVCRDLTNAIRELGSYCVTRTVLEQEGCCFPNLKGLRIPQLAMMASFNFRKCHCAFMEDIEQGIFYGEKPEILCRLSALIKRLHATNERICAILDGKESVDLEKSRKEPVISSAERRSGNAGENESVRPFQDGAASLPVDKIMARETLGGKNTKTGNYCAEEDQTAVYSASPQISSVKESRQERKDPAENIEADLNEDGETEPVPFPDETIGRLQRLHQMEKDLEVMAASYGDRFDPSARPFRPPPIFGVKGF